MAARGLHVKRLQFVVNYDFPSNLESYCHRVGRTGRQGAAGTAYSLITRNMAPLVPGLVVLLRQCEQVVEPNLLALEATAVGGSDDGDGDGDDDDGVESGAEAEAEELEVETNGGEDEG